MQRRAILGLSAAVLAACRKQSRVPSPLPQRAYVWQRDWNAAVVNAIARAKEALDGFVVLGAEVEWKDRTARAVKPRLDWGALRQCGRPVSLALRVVPSMATYAQDDGRAGFICKTARDLCTAGQAAGVPPREIQLDFDSPQKHLAAYASWVRSVRDAIRPVPLVITTLPAWLDEPDFASLVRETGRYVLQVHSLPPAGSDPAQLICDPSLARQWAARAAALGVPFEIALPTYRYRLGYDPAGKSIGIDSDGAPPSWPAGTRVTEFSSDPPAMARLVKEWQAAPPAHCQGLIWFRLPVETDRNNLPWATLSAVMQGREPRPSFQARVNGRPPGNDALQLADLSVLNDGETDDASQVQIAVTWTRTARAVADALSGWSARIDPGRALFSPAKSAPMRLPPGSERAIGWLRLEPAAPVHVEIRR